MSTRGRRDSPQGGYCFLFFFCPQDESKNPDWSDLMNYLIHPSDRSETCHSKAYTFIFNKADINKSRDRFEQFLLNKI